MWIHLKHFHQTKKKDGGHIIILNLKPLNNDIERIHFKMDTLRSAINLVKKDCYFASIALKDAYYSVAVHPSDRKYLQFFWEEELFSIYFITNGFEFST